jgi:hypothetical protein
MIPIPFMSFTAVVCDPPWEFTTYSDAGQHKSASEHYDTMPTADSLFPFPDACNGTRRSNRRRD